MSDRLSSKAGEFASLALSFPFVFVFSVFCLSPLGGRHAAVTAAINLDDKPPEPSSSVSHAPIHVRTSKSSSPHHDEHERDGSSVVGTELDRELDGGEGNDSMSHGHASPSARSPRASVLGRDEEGGYPHAPLPSIQAFDQQPPMPQQRGSPTGPPHSRSSYDPRSPSERDKEREREKERDRERYGTGSPSMPSGMRGLINPFISSEGNRSEFSPRQGKGHLSPRDDYHDRGS